MSGGQQEAAALGSLSTELREASYQMRDAVSSAEAGHRGVSIDVQAEVNDILLPCGWKLVRAERFEGYR
jgi:hypothetical protein